VAAVGLATRVAAIAARAETLAGDRVDRAQWPAVTARAVAPLAELIELALPLLRPGGVLVAWKRGAVDDPSGLGGEVSAARRALGAIDQGGRILVEPAPVGLVDSSSGALADLAAHRLVIVERSATTIGEPWPRDPATRKRRPW